MATMTDRERMYLEVFTNEQELDEFIKTAALSLYQGRTADEPVPGYFKREVMQAFHAAKELSENFRLNRGLWVPCVLRDGEGRIAGTVFIAEDRHIADAAQLDYIAVKEDLQGRGYGRILLEKAAEKIKKHSGFKTMFLSTGSKGAFYERIGMKSAGSLTAEGRTYYFYAKDI